MRVRSGGSAMSPNAVYLALFVLIVIVIVLLVVPAL